MSSPLMYYVPVFKGRQPCANKIIYGVLGEERNDQDGNPTGLYHFLSTTGILVKDAKILSASSDNEGNGDFAKPLPGSTCIALFTDDGADCYICGFAKPPAFDEASDEPAKLANIDDNSSAGDRVIKTSGGASVLLKRGGAVIIEGGVGTGVILNPTNNKITVRSSNFAHTVDGYRAIRGRKEPGATEPATLHSEEYLSQAGGDLDRETVRHGDLEDDARKEFTLAAVTVILGKESVELKTRETYYADGSWVGEGPKYQWGGPDADEPIVLGNALVNAMNTVMDIISKLTVNTAWGPSTPPLPGTQTAISDLRLSLAGNILSTYIFSTKDPADL